MARFDRFVTELRTYYTRWIDYELVDDLEHYLDSKKCDKAFKVAAKICPKIPESEKTKDFHRAIEMLWQEAIHPQIMYQQRMIQPPKPIRVRERGSSDQVKNKGLKRRQDHVDNLVEMQYYLKILSRGIKEEKSSDLHVVRSMSVTVPCQEELREIATNCEKLIKRVTIYADHIGRISYNIKHLARGEPDDESLSDEKELKDVSQVLHLLNGIEVNVEVISEEMDNLVSQNEALKVNKTSMYWILKALQTDKITLIDRNELLSEQLQLYERKRYPRRNVMIARKMSHQNGHDGFNEDIQKEIKDLRERNTSLKNQLEMKEKQIKKKNIQIKEIERKDDASKHQQEQQFEYITKHLKIAETELESLKIRNVDYSQENLKLREDLQRQRKENTENLKSFQQNNFEINQLQSELLRIKKENEELCRRLKNEHKNTLTIEQLEKQLTLCDKEIRQLRDLLALERETKQQLENMASQLEGEKEQFAKSLKENKDNATGLQTLKQNLAQTVKENRKLQDNNQELERRFKKSRRMLEIAQRELQNTQMELQNVQSDLQNAISERDDLQKRMKLEHNEIQTEVGLDKLKDEMKENQDNATALQTSEENLSHTVNERRKLQREKQELEELLKKSEKMLENTQMELQNAHYQRDGLEKRVELDQDEIQRLQQNFRSAEVEEELNEEKNENIKLKKQLRVCERDLQNTKQEIRHLKENNKDLQDRMKENQNNATALQTLEENLSHTVNERRKLQTEKQELEELLKKTEKMLENTQMELQNAHYQRDDLEKRIELDQDEIQRLQQNFRSAEVEEELNEEKNENIKLKKQLRVCERDVQNTKQEVRHLKENNKDLQDRMKENQDNATALQTLEENLSHTVNERRKLQREKQELEELLKKSEKMLENTQMELQNAHDQRDDLEKRIELDQDEIQRLQQNFRSAEVEEELNEEKNENIKLKKQLRVCERDLQNMKQEIRHLKENNKDLQDRFSKVAAAQLMHENPHIADLSDKNRPIKLSESFSELYDNEWTEAFTEIEDNSSTLPEERIVRQLRDILLTCYKYCSDVSQAQLNGLKALLVSPNTENIQHSTRFDLTAEQSKAVFDLRKQTFNIAIASIQKEMTSIYPESRKYHSLKVFIEKCTELCWLMVVQSPPVYLDGGHKSGNIFDKDVFKAYTRSGHVIDYVVWPPLHLHRGGPLLCKGTAQGKV